jgi:nicotinamide mononucleotide (NMN) deamidase PncC
MAAVHACSKWSVSVLVAGTGPAGCSGAEPVWAGGSVYVAFVQQIGMVRKSFCNLYKIKQNPSCAANNFIVFSKAAQGAAAHFCPCALRSDYEKVRGRGQTVFVQKEEL